MGHVDKPLTASSAHGFGVGGTWIPAQWMCVFSQASMDWNNLKFFLALAETGSLSLASQKLRVDHTTVARRIDMLERDLGVRLVERLSRSWRLTAEGERVCDRARTIEAGIADLARFAKGVGRLPDRVVRVSGPPTFLSAFLAPRLVPFQTKHPGLRIELVGEARQVSLSKAECDLAIRLARPREKGVVARRLAVVAYALYGSRDYLARCGEDGRDFLGYDDSLDHLPQQRWLKGLAGNRGLALRSNDLVNLLTATRAGLGLAVLPCIMTCGMPELVSVATPMPPLTRELLLLFHRDVGRAPAVRAVIDRITAITTSAKAAFLGGGR
jgi:DNA-binding transcriptional LysR family regulator